MTMSVCLSVSLSVCSREYLWDYASDLYHFLCVLGLHMSIVQSSFGGVAAGFMDDVVFPCLAAVGGLQQLHSADDVACH